MLSVYQSRMVDRARHIRPLPRPAAVMALLGLGFALCGCAQMGDSMSTAFADPAKYDLYDCKQLEPERKSLATRQAELQGLMAKAETGVAGPVVAELAYRNEAIAIEGQRKFAEEAWQKSKCHPSAPATPATSVTPSAKGAKPAKDAQLPKGTQPPSRSGTA